MKKLNFATRVTVLGTPKLSGKNNVSGAVAQNRAKVQAEINRHKLVINRDEFKKTQAEKDLLKVRKGDKSYVFTNTVTMAFNNRK